MWRIGAAGWRRPVCSPRRAHADQRIEQTILHRRRQRRSAIGDGSLRHVFVRAQTQTNPAVLGVKLRALSMSLSSACAISSGAPCMSDCDSGQVAVERRGASNGR